MTDIFTLEHSEGQKQWHHNYGRSPFNSNGYTTICHGVTDRDVAKFMEHLRSKYSWAQIDNLKTEKVKTEWAIFKNTVPDKRGKA